KHEEKSFHMVSGCVACMYAYNCKLVMLGLFTHKWGSYIIGNNILVGYLCTICLPAYNTTDTMSPCSPVLNIIQKSHDACCCLSISTGMNEYSDPPEEQKPRSVPSQSAASFMARRFEKGERNPAKVCLSKQLILYARSL
uniref:Uncharacterized protein n=1 Tax=Aegilops tauschii subsp. strangulata TaxID=200361 RepID=A0A453M340_AEGTS